MKRLFLIIAFLFFAISNSYSQKVIEMEERNGVYYVPCKINNIPMKFIFDTGASNVSISMTEAMFLLKQGALKEDDLKESVKYKIANGDVQEGTKIIIREINIDGIILKDVEAGIVHQLNAPLLLGQSAISKLGRIELNRNKLIIIPTNKNNETFLNIDIKKNLFSYGYDLKNEKFPLRIKFKYLIDNDTHFLKEFKFDEEAIFDEDGFLKQITLERKGNKEELLKVFVDVLNAINEKYGNYTKRDSDNRTFQWNLDNSNILFGLTEDNNSLLLFYNPLKEKNISKVIINEDALKHLNKYLNNTSIIDDVKGELFYNKYTNTLDYLSTTIIYGNPATQEDIYSNLTVEFSIPIDAITKITEVIANNKIMIFEIYLNKKIKYIVKSKVKGEFLDESVSKTNKVFFSPQKSLDISNIKKLQTLIREVFIGVDIETVHKQVKI